MWLIKVIYLLTYVLLAQFAILQCRMGVQRMNVHECIARHPGQ